MNRTSTSLTILGSCIFVAGVALVSPASAIILAGLLLVLAGWLTMDVEGDK